MLTEARRGRFRSGGELSLLGSWPCCDEAIRTTNTRRKRRLLLLLATCYCVSPLAVVVVAVTVAAVAVALAAEAAAVVAGQGGVGRTVACLGRGLKGREDLEDLPGQASSRPSWRVAAERWTQYGPRGPGQ